MSAVGVLPLRAGSKGIPAKNKKNYHGKPLFYWVLEGLVGFLGAENCYVSTDDDEIIEMVATDFSTVHVVRRPSELATDTASTESVVMHLIERLPGDVTNIILAQATSPFTTADDFARAWGIFESGEYDSLLSVVHQKRFFWNASGVPVNYDPVNRPRRQDFEGWFVENGAIYISKKSLYLDRQSRLGGKIGLYEMDHWSIDEIDDEVDWTIAEAKFKLAGRA